MWNTREEDDIIITEKDILKNELKIKNIQIANKIVSLFENNKIYSKDDFDKLLINLPYQDLSLKHDQIIKETTYKKILGCVNIILKYINKQIKRVQNKKRFGKKFIWVNKYKLTEKI